MPDRLAPPAHRRPALGHWWAARRAEVPPPADPLAWRPQEPVEPVAPPPIRDPIIEPHWEGRHVLAHLDRAAGPGGMLRIVDADGMDAGADVPEVVAALADALLCLDAVVDGFLTAQATHSGVGASLASDVRVSPLSVVMGTRAELVPRPLPEEATPVGFVAVDLLRVDGQNLLAVPLLERKRLLEGVVRAAGLVRITPFTRPPIRPWLSTWRASGFAGVILKEANSRYRPGAASNAWVIVRR